MNDRGADRPSIPSSRTTEEEARRLRRYGEEARSQDMSDADDRSRDEGISGRARDHGLPGRDDRPQ
jgi:hypothetical protein